MEAEILGVYFLKQFQIFRCKLLNVSKYFLYENFTPLCERHLSTKLLPYKFKSKHGDPTLFFFIIYHCEQTLWGQKQ